MTTTSKSALTPTTTYDDGKFVRTALVINSDHADGDVGSIDVVDAKGVRLCQLNISLIRKYAEDGGECLIVDTIDVGQRYGRKRALSFTRGERKMLEAPEGTALISTDFRVK